MIKIIAVGKLKEKYLGDAAAEYSKRISAYTKLETIRVPDVKCPENFSDKQVEAVRVREGASVLKHIHEKDYVITLEILGRSLSSEEFASRLERLAVSGESDIVFVIGGSEGLAGSVISRADCHLSFSKMTFPHQLMYVILLEQIYRAFKIIKNEPYHK